jgi:hypothetical protein
VPGAVLVAAPILFLSTQLPHFAVQGTGIHFVVVCLGFAVQLRCIICISCLWHILYLYLIVSASILFVVNHFTVNTRYIRIVVLPLCVYEGDGICCPLIAFREGNWEATLDNNSP